MDRESTGAGLTLGQQVVCAGLGRSCLDCAEVESLDDGTLGMLVLIARQAQRRGARISLERASDRLRADLDAAGVSHFFD